MAKKSKLRSRKEQNRLKGAMASPSLKVHEATTSPRIRTITKSSRRYRFGAKEVKFQEEQPVPKFNFGMGSIMSMFGGGASGGGGGGGMLSGIMGKGGGDTGATAMRALSKQGEEKKEGEAAPPQTEGMPDPKANAGSMPGGGGRGGLAGKIPGPVGMIIQAADKKLDEQGAAIAPLNERGRRLNKYKQGVRQYEGGTPYYTGNEDMGGIVQFQKKNPLKKWKNVGKAMKIGSSVASVLNQPVDKVTGGMATKGTNNMASLGSAMGNTTIGEKDFGGSAGNKPVAAAPTNPEATQFIDPNKSYGKRMSTGTKAGASADTLIDSTTNKAGMAPTTPLTTPSSKRATGGATRITNKAIMEGGLDPLGIPKQKKGTRKLKLKKAKRK